MRTLAPTLLGLLLALSGAASAGQYFQVPETVVVHLSGAPYQPTYVKFTDKGKETVQNLLNSIKVTVDGKEVQLSVQAKKVKEVKVDKLKNEEYVAGALGYEVPDRYFVGYLQFKDNKYVVKYEEHQTPVHKSAPGFGEFNAVAADVLGQYDENKGLPFIAPSVDPTEHTEEVMLCLPIEADVTLRPAVLQMDWYIYLNEAELGKVYLKYAKVHAHNEGDRVHLVYVPSKVDVALVLKEVMPKADEVIDTIVDPYFEEAKKVEEAKLTELLEPVKESIGGYLGELVADRILRPFLQGFINKLVLDRIEAELKGLLREPVEQALNELAGVYLSIYTSQYPETTDVSALEARKRARQSVLFEPMVEAEKSVIQSNVEKALDQVKDAVEQATQDYVDDIAELVGTSEEDVKKTINRLTVGVLEDVIDSLWSYLEWLIKLVTLNTLASMAASGLLVV
ncbi:MAG: hypothetical protein ABGY09_03825 [Euryarchaeota archaeon]